MQRVSPTAKHRLDLLHLLLIAMVAAAVIIMFVGAVQFSVQLPIELD
jgi:hypothetical protein